MRIAVRRFQEDDLDAIDRFNHRLEAGRCIHRLYSEDLSENPGADLDVCPIYDSLYVAVDGEEIRGGSWLREQYFWIDGERQRVGWMKYPVAESLVDPRYSGVPGSMVLQLLRLQPNLMALGMGGHDAPFARLLAGIRWTSSSIPFWFHVVRPFRVLRGLAYARRGRWLRIGMDLAAWSGVGWAANTLLRATRRPRRLPRDVEVSEEPRFTPWADPIWEACRDEYSALAVRDARTLDHLYPPSFPKLSRMRVTRGGRDLGWVCAQVLPGRTDADRLPVGDVASYFGDLGVGIITDGLCRPEDAPLLLRIGVEHLEAMGLDLIISYLSHEAWIEAARGLRFLPGPSTLAFYQSPRAATLLLDGSELADRCHFTRSDCDGPVQVVLS